MSDKKEPLAPCPAVSFEIKGGTYTCLREQGHSGVHMAESGDSMDPGFYPSSSKDKTWEIVFDVKADILAAERRLGRAPSPRMELLERVAAQLREVCRKHGSKCGCVRCGTLAALDKEAA